MPLRVFVIAYASADQRGLLCVAPAQGQLNLPDKTKIRGGMPKALWFQDDRDCHKFTIWNNKTINWIICLEYLGIGDRFALNLFRLCLDAWIGFSHKNPSAQASQRGGRAGSPNERGSPRSKGATKNLCS